MRRSKNVINVPFPNGMMSTARSAVAMPSYFAVELRNMLLAADGAGVKRNGFKAFAKALPAAIYQVFSFAHQGEIQVLAAVKDGTLRLLENDNWRTVYTGLDPQAVMSSVTFGGKLILTNGVDDMLMWDGWNISVIEEYVTDTSSGLAYVNSTTFKINSELDLYPAGRNVRLRLGAGNYVESTIMTSGYSNGVVTVILADSVVTSAIDMVAYKIKPPKFRFIYAAHDRLWGIGHSYVALDYMGRPDRSRVFYTAGVNDPTAWRDSTGEVPSINLADKAGITDELVAMAVKDGMSIFFGRQQMQIWSGSNPTASGDMSWQKTIPVGVPMANLVVELPNDVLFVNTSGAHTLSRVVQTEQLDVSDVGSEIDPTLQALMREVMRSQDKFAAVRHGRCDTQGWYGIAFDGVMTVMQITATSFNNDEEGAKSGWALFDGLPGRTTAMANLPDGKLLIAAYVNDDRQSSQLFVYDETCWDDNGEAFTCQWVTPWLYDSKGRRWANQYVDVLSEAYATGGIKLERLRDLDGLHGRVVEVSTRRPASFWDSAQWELADWDAAVPIPAIVRDHCVAESIAFKVSQTNTNPLTLLGLRVHGQWER